ncbi:hypothetical protein ACQKFM_16615 [Paenibacillus xylanexedens]|uniref:hypothetical protein n=1 Tax=Paenibacillus xylanexedens TaxID=528191 RepID=UPI003D092523
MNRKNRRFFGKQASVVNANRLERHFQADTPRTKLVTDITYIRAGEHFVFSLSFRIYAITKLLRGIFLNEMTSLWFMKRSIDSIST